MDVIILSSLKKIVNICIWYYNKFTGIWPDDVNVNAIVRIAFGSKCLRHSNVICLYMVLLHH